uniref:C2H2-type domain-containing protein n=1 Tax=Anopheles farauti TaxID=69004 RepID=A0A182QL55_9DIPT
MDGMCFNYDHYFAEETFVIDDFGEIFEDVVRIANTSSNYLYRDFDAELRHDSPPPASFIASNRCFEKEVSSLFSDMEYLTEVSPSTGVGIPVANAITIAVNPTEFSYKPSIRSDEAPKEVHKPAVQNIGDESTFGNHKESSLEQHVATGKLSAPIEYQRILNNYIQKGRRKLEASSYSKMKASCQAKEKSKSVLRSPTSPNETETIASLFSQSGGQHKFQLERRPTSTVTAIVNHLPLPAFDKPSSISDSSRDMIKSSLLSTRSTSSASSCPLNTAKSTTTTTTTTNQRLCKTARLHHCRDCTSSFASGELLRKHNCIIAEQYQCHLCLREFKKRKTLEHHMKSHDKVFSTDNDLRK